jgi:excisionase family DNA binding protein
VTYSIAEYCELTGLNKATVLSSIDDDRLRLVKLGKRRLILAPPPAVRRPRPAPAKLI